MNVNSDGCLSQLVTTSPLIERKSPTHREQKERQHRVRQVFFDRACRPSNVPVAGVGSRSTPFRDIDGSVH